MNTLKKFFAVALCLTVALSCLVGCHQKGEIAVKIGDVEFTSGYYACVLVFSDAEARTMVEEELSAAGDLPNEIKYWNYKVEETDYTEWVKSTTLDRLKEIAAVKTLCANAQVELDNEAISLAESEADYYWENYGYAELLENNGVSKETFKQYMLDQSLKNEYFTHLYGKGGEKEVAADKISKQLTDNYILVNKLDANFSGLNDDEKKEKEDEFNAYASVLKDGTKTFEQIYLAYNNIKEEDHKHEEVEEGEPSPQDLHATVINADYEQFESAKAMAAGDVKVVTLKDSAGLSLIVKKDIAADPYYLDYYDFSLRQEIVDTGFTDDLAKYGNELTCEVIESSIKQFKIKKIYYPETTTTTY